MNLKDKVCLITGGTRGIGAATATALAAHGAHISLVARRRDSEALQMKQRLESVGSRCELIRADCSQPDELKRCVQETADRLGGLDILVHSAGGPANGGLFQISEEEWHRAFAVHVHAIFYLSRAAVPYMQRKKEGAIILISSTAGIRGILTNVAYQVVKGALPQFTRALAREFAPDNIRVNCVAPGVIRTAFHAQMTEEQRKLNLDQRIPLRREGTPEQVATLIAELITNDYLTGETITIDGGLTMRIA